MSNKAYDFLNKFQRWLPALGVFYLAVSTIWHIPFGDEINQTVVALATLIATFLEIENGQWSRKNVVSVQSIAEDVKEIEDGQN